MRVFGNDPSRKTHGSCGISLAKLGVTTESYGIFRGCRPVAGMVVCQPYSLPAIAKLVVRREIHQWIRRKIEWFEVDWYSEHTAISGMNFCYHFTFHFTQWVLLRDELQRTAQSPWN